MLRSWLLQQRLSKITITIGKGRRQPSTSPMLSLLSAATARELEIAKSSKTGVRLKTAIAVAQINQVCVECQQ